MQRHFIRDLRLAPKPTSERRMSRFQPAAILFDMDGLLIDSEPLWKQVIAACCERRGRSFSDEDASHCIGRGIPASVAYLIATYGFSGSASELVDEIVDDFCDQVALCPELPGVEGLLSRVAERLPIAVVSSSDRRVVEAALSQRPWFAYFKTLVYGSDVERLKPNPDIFLEAARRLGVAPKGCAVLEDSLPGCRAGKAAGMFVCAVPQEHHADFSVADVILPSLEDIDHALDLSVTGTWVRV
jgi:mannitol-1-/sugar-/sorbitol-6-/2-deoxyglucose-6-phosphatase